MQANYPQNNPAGGNNYTVVHYCNTHIEKKRDSVVLREENDLRRWLVSLMFFFIKNLVRDWLQMMSSKN